MDKQQDWTDEGALEWPWVYQKDANGNHTKFERGDQVTYIPYHAEGDPNHDHAQDGFVTSTKMVGGTMYVYCRYFYRKGPYMDNDTTLRTRSVSEGCVPEQLIHRVTRDQQIVDKMLQNIEDYGDPLYGEE